jgi:hypothetical protein
MDSAPGPHSRASAETFFGTKVVVAQRFPEFSRAAAKKVQGTFAVEIWAGA